MNSLQIAKQYSNATISVPNVGGQQVLTIYGSNEPARTEDYVDVKACERAALNLQLNVAETKLDDMINLMVSEYPCEFDDMFRKIRADLFGRNNIVDADYSDSLEYPILQADDSAIDICRGGNIIAVQKQGHAEDCDVPQCTPSVESKLDEFPDINLESALESESESESNLSSSFSEISDALQNSHLTILNLQSVDIGARAIEITMATEIARALADSALIPSNLVYDRANAIRLLNTGHVQEVVLENAEQLATLNVTNVDATTPNATTPNATTSDATAPNANARPWYNRWF